MSPTRVFPYLLLIGVALAANWPRPKVNGQLFLLCRPGTIIRDSGRMTLETRCSGPNPFNVPLGPGVLGVWDPGRNCWTERTYRVVAGGVTRIDTDEVRSGPCADTGPPPEAGAPP